MVQEIVLRIKKLVQCSIPSNINGCQKRLEWFVETVTCVNHCYTLSYSYCDLFVGAIYTHIQIRTHYTVYKTSNKPQLKQIHDKFANKIDYIKFEHIYKQAVSKKHRFLFINKYQKRMQRFCSSVGE